MGLDAWVFDEGEGEPSFAEVFEAGSEVVELVIEYEPAVVGELEGVELTVDGGVLRVEAREGGLHGGGLVEVLDVTVDGGAGGFIVEELEDAGIDIVIDEDDACVGFFNQLFE